MDTKTIVVEFFKSHGELPKTDLEVMEFNYLDSGLIDSMKLVEMIVIFEDKFKIKFTHEELQSNEFRTISGLINLINSHRG
jgi:acyl carrier protein